MNLENMSLTELYSLGFTYHEEIDKKMIEVEQLKNAIREIRKEIANRPAQETVSVPVPISVENHD